MFADLEKYAISWVAALAPALAAALALTAYSATQSDPSGRAESAFLTLMTVGVLAAMAGLDTRSWRPELPITAVLATAAVWIAYQGPSRGALVSVILVTGFAVGAARALSVDDPGVDDSSADGVSLNDRQSRSSNRLAPGSAVSLALGLQFFLRPELMLTPVLDARTLVSLLVLPPVAGLGLSLLASRFGSARAGVAGSAAVVLAPGWTVTSTLAIVALAAATLVADKQQPKTWRWVAVAGLVILPVWSLPKGLLFALGAMALLGPALAGASLVAVALVAVAVASRRAQLPIEAIGPWLGAGLLVPAAFLAPSEGRRLFRAGAILTLAGAMVSRTPDAMAAGLALAALSMPVGGTVAALQRTWSAIVLLATVLLAAYPWVRADPRGDFLALLGWHSEAPAFLMLVALVVGLGLLLDLLRSHIPRWTPPTVPLVCLIICLALARHLTPTTVVVNSYEPVALAAGAVAWQGSFPPQSVASLALDSHLLGGAELEPGTPVATVRLLTAAGTPFSEWTLRAGTDTAEWAASRPDLAHREGFAAPKPWISRVSPDGGFFAHRFRTRWVSEQALEAETLEIQRDPELPPETVVSIYRLEVRR